MTSRKTPEERDREKGATLEELWTLPTEPISVRISAAVKLIGIPRTTLYELIKSGEIATVKIGRSTFIPYRCLRRLFDEIAIAAAGCLEDDADITIECAKPRRNGLAGIGDPVGPARRQAV